MLKSKKNQQLVRSHVLCNFQLSKKRSEVAVDFV